MTTIFFCLPVFALYLAAGVREQAREVRRLAHMAKTLEEADYERN